MMRSLLALLVLFKLVSCSPNNVQVDDSLEKYFTENKAAGSFALLNNNNGNFTIYNLDRYRDSSYLPASTFKIVNSLIGLQTGIITNDSMVIRWDSIRRPVDEWNRDLSMYQAFRVSAVPYYQEVARRIGRDTMQRWLDSIAYGTAKITSRVDTFWLDNSLKITSDEQLGLVKKLYFNELPFHRINQEIVKKAMLFEDKPEYRLSYKTGWGFADSTRKKHIGWVVGWIEENKHPYFFVLNLESTEPGFDMAGARMKILKGILSQLGFMEGRK
ncbi:MAG TPA: penicillin-binding transpeptidase domain-containing protein [Flavisolibacter sp.]|nr:penicillin-binding transpeptidase domain-containing protein [Flavisolibacter sp.]